MKKKKIISVSKTSKTKRKSKNYRVEKGKTIKQNFEQYPAFIKEIKEEILQSRYKAARLVNKEMLILYFKIGKMLSEKIFAQNWGAKVIKNISNDIQQAFPGIKGYSPMNLKNMRRFYDSYNFLIIGEEISYTNTKEQMKQREKQMLQFGQTVSVQIQNFGL